MEDISLKYKKIINLADKWMPAQQKNYTIDTTYNNGTLLLDVTKLSEKITHTHINYNEFFDLNTLEFHSNFTYVASIKGEVSSNLDIQLVVTSYDNHKLLTANYIGLDFNKIIKIPPQSNNIKVFLRISGCGKAKINKMQIFCYETKKEEVEQAIFQSNKDAEYLILTNAYPEKNNLYRNMFVHRRSLLYKKNKLKADVFRFNLNEDTLGHYKFDDTFVLTGGKNELSDLLNRKKYKKILIHFVNKDMIKAIENNSSSIPIIVWIHGVETEKWYRRWFNFSRNVTDLENALASIALNQERIKFMKSLYESKKFNIKFVFVSRWFKEAIAESDTNAVIKNYSIIHNVVDDQLFNYVKKDKEQRKKILSIRPYASHKYANDLSVRAILELAKKDYFNELEFNIYGEGALFEEILEPIKHFSNINIHNYFLPQEEIAALHKQHGIFLCPTRLDSQGVSMCEAMSSGLVPITNGVTAIPEFVNEECGYLAEREDYKGLAKAIDDLYLHPEEFTKKSFNSAKRMREQCSISKIIQEEINEIIH